MKKNLYYRTVIKRENTLKKNLLALVNGVDSYFRLLLEVFIRKNFGVRYFSIATFFSVAVVLCLFPAIADKISALPLFGGRMRYYGEESNFWAKYATWYLFLAGFIHCSYRRWQEVKRSPSVFDFKHYSKSAGLIHPRFFQIRIFGRKPDLRTIETLFEPALFFGLGIVLWLADQPLGTLLIIASLIYSLSYVQAYKDGDNFVMDKIDEMILNEEMENAFVKDCGPEKSRGVRFYMKKPTDEEMRRKLADDFIEDSDEPTFAL